jgi:hypothetical protein
MAGDENWVDIGSTDELSGDPAFKGVQGCPINALILKDILAFLCETVQGWLPQANVID